MPTKEQQIALERLERRRIFLEDRLLAAKQHILSKNFSGEEDRQWLQQFTAGTGLEIAPGNFPIEGAISVDVDNNILPPHLSTSGDELVNIEAGTIDFIVTNYLEAFSNTLKTLNEWHRVMRPGGVLAIVCMDADLYNEPRGALGNSRRLNTYSMSTLRAYVTRAGFSLDSIESYKSVIRMKATK